MDFVIGLIGLAAVFCLVVLIKNHFLISDLKRENEELNGQLKRLTDRDSRGRFKK
jgi:hypothetical protein